LSKNTVVFVGIICTSDSLRINKTGVTNQQGMASCSKKKNLLMLVMF